MIRCPRSVCPNIPQQKTHTHTRGYVLQAESGFIWPDSLRTRNSFSCKSSSRMFLRFRNERPTRQFLSFAMKRVSLSFSLYFVSRSTRTNFRIAFSVETRFGSNVTRFAIRDVEGERGQNQAEMEWKKTGGESKEGETGKERGRRYKNKAEMVIDCVGTCTITGGWSHVPIRAKQPICLAQWKRRCCGLDLITRGCLWQRAER